jgi:anthranilate phosphoribosyltransferase
VIGVADAGRGSLVAQALARLGAEHALVVHGTIGMDEVSPAGTTRVWEVRAGDVREWSIDPVEYGLGIADAGALAGGEPQVNALRLERILADGSDPDGRAAVVLNAAAAIYVAGLASSFKAGIDAARAAIDSGAARDALARLRRTGASNAG